MDTKGEGGESNVSSMKMELRECMIGGGNLGAAAEVEYTVWCKVGVQAFQISGLSFEKEEAEFIRDMFVKAMAIAHEPKPTKESGE